MKLGPVISKISFVAVIAALFLQVSDTKAQPPTVSETCTVLVERVLHRPGDSGFDEIAARVENLTAFGPKTPGTSHARPTSTSDFEYMHFEFIHDSCAAENEESIVFQKAGDPECSHIGCQAVFPGNNMPIGSVMTIESCRNRVETIRRFRRVGTSPDSTGTDGIWQLTAYNTRVVSVCPSYQEP